MRAPADNPTLEASLYPEGFLAIKKGLFDHLEKGRMTASMLPVYFVVLQQCDWATGIWNGNAHRIYYALGGTMGLSEIRKQLAKLCRSAYLKSFHRRGSKGNYNILINRYIPTRGELKGRVLNAIDSSSWERPTYEDRSEKDVTRVCDATDARVKRKSKGSETRPYQDIQDVQASKEGKNSSLPTIQESDGRQESSHTSSEPTPRANEGLDPADIWGQWLSDLFQARACARYTPCSEDIRRIEIVLSEYDPMLLAVTAYLFCQRPKGFAGLADAFGQFWKESEGLKKDAHDYLSDQESPLEALTDLHDEVFPREEMAHNRGVTTPSMAVFTTILGILNLGEQVGAAHVH